MFKKALGLILVYLGIIVLLFGFLAMFLPGVPNEQVQLILASFETPSHSTVLNFVNRLFLSMIQYAAQMLIAGGAITLFGIIILILPTPKRAVSNRKKQSTSRKKKFGIKASPAKHYKAVSSEWRRLPRAMPSQEIPAISEAIPDATPLLELTVPTQQSTLQDEQHTDLVSSQASPPLFAYQKPHYAKAIPVFSSNAVEASVQDEENPRTAESTHHQEPTRIEAPVVSKDASPAKTPVRIRSTMKSNKAHFTSPTASATVHPTSALIYTPPEQPGSEPGADAAPQPQYQSGRIRSTMKSKEANT